MHEISTAHKKYKYWQIKIFLALSLSDVVHVLILLVNLKMPTLVGILTFMSRMNFVLSWVEHGKSFITSGLDQLTYLTKRSKTSIFPTRPPRNTKSPTMAKTTCHTCERGRTCSQCVWWISSTEQLQKLRMSAIASVCILAQNVCVGIQPRLMFSSWPFSIRIPVNFLLPKKPNPDFILWILSRFVFHLIL